MLVSVIIDFLFFISIVVVLVIGNELFVEYKSILIIKVICN